MPVKVAFMQLSSCWGCHQSLLNAHLRLLPLLPQLDIVYWHTVIDAKLKSLKERPDGDITVGFLEGVVRTKQDTENAKLMRQKCSIVVAFGACPCYGSVAGLANLYNKEDLVKRKFGDSEFISDPESHEPKENVPGFEEYIINLKDVIDVDMFIPGCPPTTDNIIASITYLLSLTNEDPPSLNKKGCVCDACNLRDKGCFLDKDEFCYGSITASGCELMCPNKGDLCYGCFKSTNKLGKKVTQLQEISHNIGVLSSDHAATIQHFLDVFLGSSNITSFYFRGDLLQRLAYEPNSFELKEIQSTNGAIFILDVSPTGNKIIDEIIGVYLYLLKDDPNFKFSSKSVCSHCDRDIADKIPTELKRDYEGLPIMDTCFLEQGYICLGPVTQAGCGTVCPNNANAPCLGCYGGATGVKDPGVKFMSTIGSLCFDKDPEEVIKLISDPAGLFNRFTLPASTLGHRYHDKLEDETIE
ncbi:MAG: NADH-quinone oxidoreductase subunit B family protein [Promethearchaeota archaeon]